MLHQPHSFVFGKIHSLSICKAAAPTSDHKRHSSAHIHSQECVCDGLSLREMSALAPSVHTVGPKTVFQCPFQSLPYMLMKKGYGQQGHDKQNDCHLPRMEIIMTWQAHFLVYSLLLSNINSYLTTILAFWDRFP